MTPLQEELGTQEYERLVEAWSRAERVGPILPRWPDEEEEEDRNDALSA